MHFGHIGLQEFFRSDDQPFASRVKEKPQQQAAFIELSSLAHPTTNGILYNVGMTQCGAAHVAQTHSQKFTFSKQTSGVSIALSALLVLE